ncbi:MAG: twin-arginine translocation signal domain-containing protein [Acidimicrobiia bacterium]
MGEHTEGSSSRREFLKKAAIGGGASAGRNHPTQQTSAADRIRCS